MWVEREIGSNEFWKSSGWICASFPLTIWQICEAVGNELCAEPLKHYYCNVPGEYIWSQLFNIQWIRLRGDFLYEYSFVQSEKAVLRASWRSVVLGPVQKRMSWSKFRSGFCPHLKGSSSVKWKTRWICIYRLMDIRRKRTLRALCVKFVFCESTPERLLQHLVLIESEEHNLANVYATRRALFRANALDEPVVVPNDYDFFDPLVKQLALANSKLIFEVGLRFICLRTVLNINCKQLCTCAPCWMCCYFRRNYFVFAFHAIIPQLCNFSTRQKIAIC